MGNSRIPVDSYALSAYFVLNFQSRNRVNLHSGSCVFRKWWCNTAAQCLLLLFLTWLPLFFHQKTYRVSQMQLFLPLFMFCARSWCGFVVKLAEGHSALWCNASETPVWRGQAQRWWVRLLPVGLVSQWVRCSLRPSQLSKCRSDLNLGEEERHEVCRARGGLLFLFLL